MTDNPLPVEIDVQSVKQLLEDSAEFLLLDCREQSEYDTARIDSAMLIPMGEVQYRLTEIESYRDKLVVVHCHHGGRSLRVTNYLREMGFEQAQNMSGGIDAWSLQVDQAVPRYS